MELDSGDGLMEGLRIISNDTPARISEGVKEKHSWEHFLKLLRLAQRR
jgi:hypothetical protein